MSDVTEDNILLVYDSQCPFCENYSQLVRLRNNVGQLTIVDARQPSAICDEITSQGLNLDQGMVLKLANRYYHGADALHVLALLSSRSGLFNKINYWCFKSKTVSRLLYPILRRGRNLALKILRKSKINHVE